MCQKAEEVEFPTNSTAKNCTIFSEVVLLPKMSTNLQEIQKDRHTDRQTDRQTDREIKTSWNWSLIDQ
jgi:hypothetical protein